jgi:hypothetical protein
VECGGCAPSVYVPSRPEAAPSVGSVGATPAWHDAKPFVGSVGASANVSVPRPNAKPFVHPAATTVNANIKITTGSSLLWSVCIHNVPLKEECNQCKELIILHTNRISTPAENALSRAVPIDINLWLNAIPPVTVNATSSPVANTEPNGSPKVRCKCGSRYCPECEEDRGHYIHLDSSVCIHNVYVKEYCEDCEELIKPEVRDFMMELKTSDADISVRVNSLRENIENVKDPEIKELLNRIVNVAPETCRCGAFAMGSDGHNGFPISNHIESCPFRILYDCFIIIYNDYMTLKVFY